MTSQNQACKDKEEYELSIEKLKNKYSRKIKAANDKIEEVEQRCARDNKAAAIAKREAEEFRNEQKKLLNEEKIKIEKLADEKIHDKIITLESAKEKEVFQIESKCKKSIKKYKTYYETKHIAKEAWYVMVRMFCIVWLVIQTLCSKYFRNEVMVVLKYIKDYLIKSLDIIILIESNLTGSIKNKIIANIVYAILDTLCMLVAYIAPIVIIVGGGFWYSKSKYFDKINRWIMIGTAILFVAMASEMVYTPKINLLLLWVIIQLTVPIIRFILIPLIRFLFVRWNKMDNDKKKNIGNDIMIIVLMLATSFFILWSFSSFVSNMNRRLK